MSRCVVFTQVYVIAGANKDDLKKNKNDESFYLFIRVVYVFETYTSLQCLGYINPIPQNINKYKYFKHQRHHFIGR